MNEEEKSLVEEFVKSLSKAQRTQFIKISKWISEDECAEMWILLEMFKYSGNLKGIK